MANYKEDIQRCVDRIKQLSKQSTLEFEVQSSVASSDKWFTEVPKGTDVKSIDKRIQAILEGQNPDAIRFSYWINGKKQPVCDIKLTQTYIPAVDEAKRRGDDVESIDSMRMMMHEMMSEFSGQFKGALSGMANQLGDARIQEVRTENQTEIMKMRFENEIEKKEEKIRQLTSEVEELESLLSEEEKENEQLKNELAAKSSGTSELIRTGSMLLAGLTGNNQLASALAGIFGSTEPQQLQQNTNGLSEVNSPRMESEMEIQGYIQTLSDDSFTNFEMLILYLKQYPQAIEMILKEMMRLEENQKQTQKKKQTVE
jgi:uncharacterized phage infection (PIP) family protein YhgE